MQAAIVYAKSAAGQEEIRSHSVQLTRPMRNLLLCVDGKRSAEALEALAQACGAPQDALQQLQTLGFIHAMPLPHTQQESATPQTQPRPLAPAEAQTQDEATAADAAGPDTLQPFEPAFELAASPTGDYTQLYARMNALVSEHLGLLKSYAIQLKIEQCNSVDQLRALLPELEAALSKALGKDQAQAMLIKL